jgi:predicted MPP superfamily phosphohydrolase
MVSLAALIIPLLALWLWWPLHSLSRRARLLAAVATAALGCTPALLLVLLREGTVAYRTLAYLQVPGGWVLAVLLMIAVFIVLRDGLWALAALSRSTEWRQHLHAPRLTAGALALAGLLSAWGVANALRPPEVQERTLRLPGLPTGLEGLRVAVLADIHATPVTDERHVQTLVDRTNAARPDLIVLPGDMADGDATLGAKHVAPLAQLRAPHGVWAAPGNHEYYNGYDAWADVFQTLNLAYLENQSQIIDIRGKRVAISGVGDPAYGRLSAGNRDPQVPEGLPPDIDAVVQQATGADLHLLLAHQPKLARVNAGKGLPGPQAGMQQVRAAPARSGRAVDLQISGHTHGGHVIGMDRWMVAPVNNGFVRGLYRVDGMQLFVSSGAGLWIGFPIRLGVPSAIEVLVLRAPGAARS